MTDKSPSFKIKVVKITAITYGMLIANQLCSSVIHIECSYSFSRPKIITVRTIGSQLIGRLSGDSTFFLFVSLVLGSSTEPDIHTKAVGGWLNRGLSFHRENSDGHSAKYNNVGSQRSNGTMGSVATDNSSKVLLTLHLVGLGSYKLT